MHDIPKTGISSTATATSSNSTSSTFHEESSNNNKNLKVSMATTWESLRVVAPSR